MQNAERVRAVRYCARTQLEGNIAQVSMGGSVDKSQTAPFEEELQI